MHKQFLVELNAKVVQLTETLTTQRQMAVKPRRSQARSAHYT